MALPKNFGTQPPRRPANRSVSTPLPPIEEIGGGLREQQQKQAPAKTPRAEQHPRQQSRVSPETLDDSRYEIDPRTGKRFKKLPGIKDPRMLKGGASTISKKASGLSPSDMRSLFGEDEDFAKVDTFNGGLEGLAETFLAHLRVPPSQKEIERLREAKIRAKKFQDEEYASLQDNLSSKYDKEDE